MRKKSTLAGPIIKPGSKKDVALEKRYGIQPGSVADKTMEKTGRPEQKPNPYPRSKAATAYPKSPGSKAATAYPKSPAKKRR